MKLFRVPFITLIIAMMLAACAGPVGPQGSQGPAGPAGPQGPSGPPADSAGLAAEYVGSETCAECHETLYETFILSGHPYKLNQVVDGEPPEYPFSEVNDPPEGYTWDDIAYVIGGYGWKARFIDVDGYIITGDADATTQYNLENDDLDIDDGWVAYHAGEENLEYTCGTCHTTGYSSWPEEAHQNDMPGLVGTWAEDGVQCEACHGPLSIHVNDPNAQQPIVDRDADACGVCHSRGDQAQIDASGLFVQHHEQYEDFFQSKHAALDCVDCHNPHATTRYQAEAVAIGSPPGINVTCDNCHWEQAQFYPDGHQWPDCVDCHMAYLGKSAVSDDARLRGDIPSHLFAINPYAEEQFYEGEDGKQYSQGYITLPYACSGCHWDGEDNTAPPLTFEEMQDFATGYHDRPTEEPPVEEEAAP